MVSRLGSQMVSPIRSGDAVSRRQSLRRMALGLGAALGGGTSLTGCGGGEDDVEHLRRQVQMQEMVHQALSRRPRQMAGLAAGWQSANRVHLAAGGVRRVTAPTSLTHQDMLIVGSLGKAMVSAVAAMLVEEGKLRWDTSLAQGFPAMRTAIHPAWAGVTLLDLLHHRSGLITMQEAGHFDEFFLSVLSAEQTFASEAERRAFFCEWALAKAPNAGRPVGQNFEYSNGGYIVAGHWLSWVAGADFKLLFNRLIAERLGVTGTWLRPERLSEEQPVGHVVGPAGLEVVPLQPNEIQEWLDVMAPAGLYATSSERYAHWMGLHARAMRGEPTALPAPYVKLLRESAMNTSYCMGWIPISMNGMEGWMHDGLWEGFHAMACFERRGRFACHALTNTGSAVDGESPLAPLIMEMLKL